VIRVINGCCDSVWLFRWMIAQSCRNCKVSHESQRWNVGIWEFPLQFRFDHDGNAASVEEIAQWSGVSAGSVVNCTCRVMIAFLALHDSAICWPSEDEKEESKEWVEVVSCFAWQDGYCMVNRTPVVLFQKPGYHGKAYFDQKSNYSLNLQVGFTLFLHVCLLIMTAHYPSKSLYNQLCDWALWKCTWFDCLLQFENVSEQPHSVQQKWMDVGQLSICTG